MNALFRPGIALMKRMGFPARFALTGLLLGALLLFFLFHSVTVKWERMRQLESERAGGQFIGELVEWNKVLIDYRSIAITAPVGDRGVKERLARQATTVEQTLAKLTQSAERYAPMFDSRKGIEGIRNGWKELQSKVSSLALDGEFAQKAFAAHGAEFGRLYTFMRELGDMTGMAFEPDIAGFYLGFSLANNTPKVAGITVRIAAYETLNIARGDIKPTDKIFYEVTEALWKDAFSGIETMLSQAAQFNPALKTRLEQQFAEVKGKGTELLDFSRKSFIKADGISVSQADVTKAAQPAIDAAWKLVDVNRTLLDEVYTAEQAKVRSLLITEIVLALLVIVAAAYLFVAMFLSISEATGRLGEAAARVAQGDFTTRVGLDGNDEMTQVARRFDEMAQTLGSVLAAAKRSAEQVFDASRGISETAVRIAQSSHNQLEAVQSTATSLEEMTVSVSHVADNAKSALSLSEAASHAVNDGQARMGTAVAEVRQVAGSVGEAAKRVTELGTQADAIGNIVNTIKDIADQTNLLALNAAIEAARAGESGRGFAVVADEVRKLAENTRRATDEIATMIGNVLNGVQSSIEQMTESREQAKHSVTITDEAAESLDGIRQNTGTNLERNRDIAHAADEQRRAAENISRNVERIAQMAEENDKSVQGVTIAAERLRTLAEELSAGVARFRSTA